MVSLKFEVFGDEIKLTDPITGEHEYTIKRRRVVHDYSESFTRFEVQLVGESITAVLWKTIEAAEFYALALKSHRKGGDLHLAIQGYGKTGSIPKS